MNDVVQWPNSLPQLEEFWDPQLSALEHVELLGLHAYFSDVVELAALPKLTSLAFGEVLREPDLSYDPIEFYKVLSDERLERRGTASPEAA